MNKQSNQKNENNENLDEDNFDPDSLYALILLYIFGMFDSSEGDDPYVEEDSSKWLN